MEFKRNKYLNKIVESKGNGLIKIITGIRRCGKSYLLNNIFYNYLIQNKVKEENIIKFAFDLEEDVIKLDNYYPNEKTIIKKRGIECINNKKFIAYINDRTKKKGNYYLLLDEIQILDRFENVMNSFLNHPNYDVYVTGSNSKFLSSDIITEFSGRGDEIHLLPLSFEEYYEACGLSKQEAFKDYLYYGGLPLVQKRKTKEQKIKELKNAEKNIYIADIIRRHRIKDDNVLSDILKVISSSVGSPINPTKLENTFNSVYKTTITNDTIKNYIKWFEESFIISKSLNYDVKGKAYIGTPYKLYFEDIGIKNSVLDFREIDETDIMENIIYNQLRYKDYNVDVGIVEINEPTNRKDKNEKTIYENKKLEIDFIATKGDEKLYIQSAYKISDKEKEKQETKSLLKVDDSFSKVLIVNEDIEEHYNASGIRIVSLLDYLTQKD